MSPMLLEPPTLRRNDVTVKIDAEVITDAKMVAAARSVTLAEYLSELIRPLVRRDLETETGRRLSAGRPPSPSPAPKKGGGKS